MPAALLSSEAEKIGEKIVMLGELPPPHENHPLSGVVQRKKQTDSGVVCALLFLRDSNMLLI